MVSSQIPAIPYSLVVSEQLLAAAREAVRIVVYYEKSLAVVSIAAPCGQKNACCSSTDGPEAWGGGRCGRSAHAQS